MTHSPQQSSRTTRDAPCLLLVRGGVHRCCCRPCADQSDLPACDQDVRSLWLQGKRRVHGPRGMLPVACQHNACDLFACRKRPQRQLVAKTRHPQHARQHPATRCGAFAWSAAIAVVTAASQRITSDAVVSGRAVLPLIPVRQLPELRRTGATLCPADLTDANDGQGRCATGGGLAVDGNTVYVIARFETVTALDRGQRRHALGRKDHRNGTGSGWHHGLWRYG